MRRVYKGKASNEPVSNAGEGVDEMLKRIEREGKKKDDKGGFRAGKSLKDVSRKG